MSRENWPEKALEAEKEEKERSPCGCGGCRHANWASPSDVGDKQRFNVILCNFGINLPGGLALFFCPFQNAEVLLDKGMQPDEYHDANNPPPKAPRRGA